MSTWNEIKSLLLAPLLYLGIKTEVAMVLFILMAIDMLVGTVKSLVMGNSFSMKKFVIGYLSKIVILLFPLTVALMGKGLERDFKIFVDLTMWVLIVNDGLSVLRNLYIIRTRREMESQDLVARLLHVLAGRMLLIYETVMEVVRKKRG